MSGLPFPTPEDLPYLGIKTESFLSLLHWQADSLPEHHPGRPIPVRRGFIITITHLQENELVNYLAQITHHLLDGKARL